MNFWLFQSLCQDNGELETPCKREGCWNPAPQIHQTPLWLLWGGLRFGSLQSLLITLERGCCCYKVIQGMSIQSAYFKSSLFFSLCRENPLQTYSFDTCKVLLRCEKKCSASLSRFLQESKIWNYSNCWVKAGQHEENVSFPLLQCFESSQKSAILHLSPNAAKFGGKWHLCWQDLSHLLWHSLVLTVQLRAQVCSPGIPESPLLRDFFSYWHVTPAEVIWYKNCSWWKMFLSQKTSIALKSARVNLQPCLCKRWQNS